MEKKVYANYRHPMELDNLNPDGSRKSSISGGWPHRNKIEAVCAETRQFYSRVNSSQIKRWSDLRPYVQEHLDNFGAITGSFEISEPVLKGGQDYKATVRYNFFGKQGTEEVSGSLAELKEENFAVEFLNDLPFNFNPRPTVQSFPGNKFVLRPSRFFY